MFYSFFPQVDFWTQCLTLRAYYINNRKNYLIAGKEIHVVQGADNKLINKKYKNTSKK